MSPEPSVSVSPEPFRAALRCRMESRGMTQAQLAAASLLSSTLITRLLSGKRALTAIACRRLAAVFGVAPTELVAGTDAAGLEGLPGHIETQIGFALQQRAKLELRNLLRGQQTLPVPREHGCPCPRCGRFVPKEARYCCQCGHEPPPTGALLVARLLGFYSGEGGHQRPDTRGPRPGGES